MKNEKTLVKILRIIITIVIIGTVIGLGIAYKDTIKDWFKPSVEEPDVPNIPSPDDPKEDEIEFVKDYEAYETTSLTDVYLGDYENLIFAGRLNSSPEIIAYLGEEKEVVIPNLIWPKDDAYVLRIPTYKALGQYLNELEKVSVLLSDYFMEYFQFAQKEIPCEICVEYLNFTTDYTKEFTYQGTSVFNSDTYSGTFNINKDFVNNSKPFESLKICTTANIENYTDLAGKKIYYRADNENIANSETWKGLDIESFEYELKNEEAWNYTWKDNNLCLSGYRGKEKVAKTPKMFFGYEVKGMLDFSSDYVESLNVTSNIKFIGVNNLNGDSLTGNIRDCLLLKNINFEEGLEEVGILLKSCNSVNTLTLPLSLKKATDLVMDCENLTTVNINSSIIYGANGGVSGKNLENINIIESSTTFPSIMGAGKITKLVLPKNLTNLENIKISASNLEEIVLPTNITTLPSQFIYNCPNLKKINLDNIKVYEASCLANTAIEELALNDEIEFLGAGCFSENNSLKKITVEAGFNDDLLSNVEISPFNNCWGIKIVDLKEGYNGEIIFYGVMRFDELYLRTTTFIEYFKPAIIDIKKLYVKADLLEEYTTYFEDCFKEIIAI